MSDQPPTQENQAAETLPPAEISFGVVLLPAKFFRDYAAEASAGISSKMANGNIVDEARFPAHVSLYLGGTTAAGLEALVSKLGPIASAAPRTLRITDLEQGTRGFLSVAVERSHELVEFTRSVIEVCGAVHRQNPVYRPHILRRWHSLVPDRRERLRRLGTYKTAELLDPHVSLAAVAESDLSRAKAIAAELIQLPQSVHVEAVQIVEVGHENERWVVKQSWPICD